MRPGSPGLRETPMRRPSAGDSEAWSRSCGLPARFASADAAGIALFSPAARTRSTRVFCRHAVACANGFAAAACSCSTSHTAPWACSACVALARFSSVTKFIIQPATRTQAAQAQGDQLCSSPPEPPMNNGVRVRPGIQPLGGLAVHQRGCSRQRHGRSGLQWRWSASFFLDGPHMVFAAQASGFEPHRAAARANVPSRGCRHAVACGRATRRAPLAWR